MEEWLLPWQPLRYRRAHVLGNLYARNGFVEILGLHRGYACVLKAYFIPQVEPGGFVPFLELRGVGDEPLHADSLNFLVDTVELCHTCSHDAVVHRKRALRYA